uniref:High light inducible protein n=1 Tax=Hapterophycus canaliculatus TaxID=2567908 RepID=A0A5A4MJ88_9PHAE|nr:hypothetical protein Scana_136 [Hapterophycus canaliculatus]AXU40779.1 hypothetical protein Scana_136 [Hapterophycus canaliculatus]
MDNIDNIDKNSNDYEARWGFYLKSEILNGRVAMIALIIILVIEVFTKQTLFNLMSFF